MLPFMTCLLFIKQLRQDKLKFRDLLETYKINPNSLNHTPKGQASNFWGMVHILLGFLNHFFLAGPNSMPIWRPSTLGACSTLAISSVSLIIRSS